MGTRIDSARVCFLNDRPWDASGRYVLYWMQASQRTRHNDALEYAVERANGIGRPVVVCFGLTADYPEANLRHYWFMAEGLVDVGRALRRRGICFVVRHAEPAEVALELGRDSAGIVCDAGYLRHQKAWREQVGRASRVAAVQVESDVVVPVEEASGKREYAARTFRPRVERHRERYLKALRGVGLRRKGGPALAGVDASCVERLLDGLSVDTSVGVARRFRGGQEAAARELGRFVRSRLGRYGGNRNRPETDDVSYMSMYLHFGQVSPVTVALAVRDARGAGEDDRSGFLEELIVRRELACNYVHYERDYDRYRALPGWARATLKRHAGDRREHVYSRGELEKGRTHDRYWNAAMCEMRETGYMHNSMRMYWGKKILEWSGTPEGAFRTALYLNNRYFVDGRDPNSFANVGWVFGLHDRPWGERAIFGTVRYMNARGLERKCDIAGYVEKVRRLVGARSL